MSSPARELTVLPLVLTWGLAAGAYVAKAVFTASTTPLILDADDAMRLVEVQDLISGQAWFDLSQHRMNAPFGASMHWSRLIDLPESLIVMLLRPLAGDSALIWMAWVWPLLLLLPLLMLVERLALTLGGTPARLPALVLTPLSLVTLGEFAPGRVDHHSAQVLATLAMVLGLLAAVRTFRSAALAGAAGAIAIAIGVEGMPAVVAAAFALGLAFVADPRNGAVLRDFLLGLATTLSLALAATVAPSEWFVPRLDAISIVYVVGAVCGVGCALAMTARPARTWPLRLVGALCAGGLAIGVLLVLFPDIRGGPYAALDPWLVRNWLVNVAESQTFLASLGADPVYPLALAVPALVALGTALSLAVRRSAGRTPWLVYALLLASGLAVMAVQVRAGRIVTPLAIPGGAVLVAEAIAWGRRRAGLIPAAAVIASLIGSAGIGVAIVVALVPIDGTVSGAGGQSRLACLQPGAFQSLSGGPAQRLMAPIDLGSHVLLYTPHSVVGAPYHRNQQGLLDTFRFFNAPAAEAQEIARARGIGRVVVCPGMKEMTGMVPRATDSVAGDFANGTVPAWLHEEPGAGPLRIFVVDP